MDGLTNRTAQNVPNIPQNPDQSSSFDVERVLFEFEWRPTGREVPLAWLNLEELLNTFDDTVTT